MKTLSMYLRAARTEAEAAGESAEGMASSVSELRSELLALTGGRVDIQIDENNFKSTFQILKELSEVWGDLTDITQANITEMIGGKRNANVVTALLNNFELAESVVEDSMNSAGSALEENEKYLDSINGKIAEFRASFESLSTTLVGSDFVKGIVELGTGALNALNSVAQLVDSIGGLNSVLMITASIITTINAQKIIGALDNARKRISKLASDVAGVVSLTREGIQSGKSFGSALSSAFGALGTVSKLQIGIGAITTALSVAVALYQAHQRELEEQRNAASEAAKAYQETAKSLEDYKDNIDELRKALDSGNLSQEEAYNTRKQLMEIESDLIETYGKEAEGINLVTGEINAQKEAVDRLSESEWNLYNQRNTEAINRASDLFTNFSPSDFGILDYNIFGKFSIGAPNMQELQKAFEDVPIELSTDNFGRYISEFYQELENEIENLGHGIEISPFDFPSGPDDLGYEINIDADSVYDVLDVYREIYDVTESIGKEYFGENYLQYVGGALGRTSQYISEIETMISENESIFNTYVEGMLMYDKTYRDLWGDILAAQQQYDDAVLSGDTDAVAAALAAMQSAQDAFLAAGFDNASVNLYADNFFKQFNDAAKGREVLVQIRAVLSDEDDSLGGLIRSALLTLSDDTGAVDLNRLLNIEADYERSGKANDRHAELSAEEEAYVALKFVAGEYGITVEELYNTLAQLGMVQGEVTGILENGRKSYEALQSTAENAVTAQIAANDVIADNTYISEEAYKAIASLAGGEVYLSSCVNTANGYLVTNAAALREIIGASQEAALENIRVAESHERLNYHELVSQLQDVTDEIDEYDDASADLVDSILDQIDAVDKQIAQYKLLEQQVLGVTNAFTEMENARAFDEATDYTDDLSSMVQDLLDAFSNREFGSETFRTAFEALVPEDIYDKFTDTGDQIDAGWKYIHNKLDRYFTYDDGNVTVEFGDVKQFVQDALATSYGDSTVFTGSLEEFNVNPQIESIEQLAEAMGITTTAAFALGNAITRFTTTDEDFLSALVPDSLESKIYACDAAMADLLKKRDELGRAGKVDTSDFQEVQDEIAGASREMEDLRDKAREQINANISIDSNIEDQQEIVDDLREQLDALTEGDATYATVEADYLDAQKTLATLLRQKYELEEPTELLISVALESVQSEIASVRSQLDEIAAYDEERKIYVPIDIADQDKVDRLVEQLDDLKSEQAEIQAYVNLDDEDIKEDLDEIEEFVIHDKSFSVVFSNYRTLKTQLEDVLGLLDDTKNIAVGYRLNSSGGLIVSDSSSGKTGRSDATGTPGTKFKERDTLVGELGQELMVDTRSGTYKTVGDNGPELIDIPKGAIIFDHQQTEDLLKKKRTSRRGQALAMGNAHATPFGLSDTSYDFGVTSAVSSLEEQLEDTLKKMEETLSDLLGDFEHSIFLMERNGGSTQEIVAVYRQMQDALHNQAEQYRSMGLEENSDYIQELQKQWWEYQDSIQDAIVSEYETVRASRENAANITENLLENAITNRDFEGVERYAADIIAYYKDMQSVIQQQIDYYRSRGYEDTSDEISDLIDLWWEYGNGVIEVQQRIVEASSDAVDEIQSVYDTLHTAADEYAAGGYITIDTLQEILNMGAEYMQMLMDENGQLVINEERINAVIAARTEQLALENAMSYVDRLRLATQEGSIENLNRLLYATSQNTDATWGLVYANLALIGLSGDQYQAALHNINAMRALAENAIYGVTEMGGAASDSLEEMRDGVGDILEYVMAMLKQRVEDQIDALEEMKDSYREIVELRKESLDEAREETEYQDEVASKIREIAELQERINALSLDDSRDANAQRVQLEEQMAELQKELADQQSEYATNAQKDALDDMVTSYEEEKDKEIAILEDSISSYQKLYDMAIDYIERRWDTLLSELLQWNTEAGDTLNSTIVTAWENALKAAQRYGSYVSALNVLGSSGGGGSTGGSHNDLLPDSVTGGSYSNDEMIHAIIRQMYANARSWFTLDEPERSRREAESLRLGASLAQYGINAVRGDDGVWYIGRVGGEKLFEKYKKYIYHTGGVAGNQPTLKQNEVMSVLQKGELVLDKRRENALYRLIDFATEVSRRFGEALRSGGDAMIAGIARNQMPSADSLAPINENRSQSIQFGNVYIYGANDDTVAKHQEVNRQFTNEVLRYLNIKR